MSTVTTDQIEALMSTGLETTALQGVIDREEAWLANDPKVGIGLLVGERTQRIRVRTGETYPLRLRRPTDENGGFGSGGSLTVIDGEVERDDIVLTGSATIWPDEGPWRGPFVEVTSIPTDQAAVEAAVIELVRLAVSASPYRQEANEGHSYSRPKELVRMRQDIAESLDPHRGPTSTYTGNPR